MPNPSLRALLVALLALALSGMPPSLGRAQTPIPFPAAKPAPNALPKAPVSTATPAKVEEEEGDEDEDEDEETVVDPKDPKKKLRKKKKKERPEGWSPLAMARIAFGYDDNASLSDFQKPGTSTPSWLVETKLRLGAAYERDALSLDLAYQFEQSVYFDQKGLDMQGHGAALGVAYEAERYELGAGYEPMAQWLTSASSFKFYGYEHPVTARARGGLTEALWGALRYDFTYFDVRDPQNQQLAGQQHVIGIGPEYRFEDVGKVALRYELDIARLGVDSTSLRGRAATIVFDVPLSYVGNGVVLEGEVSPHEKVDLKAKLGISRRNFDDVSADISRPRGHSTLERPRADTVYELGFDAAWSFWRHLSLELSLDYLVSNSNFEGVKFTGSYHNFVFMLGLAYRRP